MRHTLLLLILPSLFIACSRSDLGRTTDQTKAAAQSFRPIAYHRTGGQNQADEHITITNDGTIESRTKFGVTRSQLTQFQLMQLARAFENFDKLQPTYPPAKPNVNAASVTLHYGDKSVTASEAAETLPQPFIIPRDRVTAIARDLPRTK